MKVTPKKKPEIVDYLYSTSFAEYELPTNVGPRSGLVCSDTMLLSEHYGGRITIKPLEIHGRKIGGYIEADCHLPHSEDISNHVRHVGLFDDEKICSLAYSGLAKAVLGSNTFKLYYGTAFRLMSEDEHAAFLTGHVNSLSYLKELEDYHRSKSSIAMLYHHAPFWQEVSRLTDDMLNYGRFRKYESQVRSIIEMAKNYKERVDGN